MRWAVWQVGLSSLPDSGLLEFLTLELTSDSRPRLTLVVAPRLKGFVWQDESPAPPSPSPTQIQRELD
jgi:hypothetical protein